MRSWSQRQRSFDLAIQMHGDGRATNVFTAALGASRWGGLSRVFTPGGSTVLVDDAAHEADRCVEAVRAVGLTSRLALAASPVEPTDRAPALGRRRRTFRGGSCGWQPP